MRKWIWITVFLMAGLAQAVDSAVPVPEIDPVSSNTPAALENRTIIEIQGAETFPPADIRKALRSNPELLISSHSSKPQQEFLDKLIELTVLGYQQAGFPYVDVSADVSESGGKTVLTIVEGMRFTMGEVITTGLQGISQEAVLDRLTPRHVSAFEIYGRSDNADKNEGAGTGSAVQGEQSEGDVERGYIIWRPDRPVNCTDEQLEYIKSSIISLFSEHGYFFPELDVSLQFDKMLKRANLNIKVRSNGPQGVIGRIEVAGLNHHTTNEVLDYVGLKEGQKLTRELLETAERRLVNSGRFTAVDLKPMPPDNQNDRLTLAIELQEAANVPGLSTPLSELENAFLDFGEWVRGLSQGAQDIRVRFSADQTNVLTFVSSVSNGLALVAGDADTQDPSASGICSALLVDSARMELLREGDRKRLWSNVLKNLGLWMEVRPPQADLGKSGRFLLGAGARNKFDEDLVKAGNAFLFDIYAPPCFFLWMANSTNFIGNLDGSVLTVELKKQNVTLEFNTETQRLKPLIINDSETSQSFIVEIKPGLFHQTVSPVSKYSNGESYYQKRPVFLSAVISEALKIMSDLPNFDSAHARRTRLVADVLRVFVDAGIVLSAGDAFEQTSDPFKIPVDEKYEQNLPLAFMANCYSTFGEIFPEGSWPVVISREGAMMSAGLQPFAGEAIPSLMARDDIGPVGCLVLSEVFGYLGASDLQAMFTLKSRAVSDQDGFKKDVDLISHALSNIGLVSENGYFDRVDWAALAEKVANAVPDEEQRNNCIQEIRSICDLPAEERFERFAMVIWQVWLENVVKAHTLDPAQHNKQ